MGARTETLSELTSRGSMGLDSYLKAIPSVRMALVLDPDKPHDDILHDEWAALLRLTQFPTMDLSEEVLGTRDLAEYVRGWKILGVSSRLGDSLCFFDLRYGDKAVEYNAPELLAELYGSAINIAQGSERPLILPVPQRLVGVLGESSKIGEKKKQWNWGPREGEEACMVEYRVFRQADGHPGGSSCSPE